ncbi:helix-turn-helix domain-containing protein [Actinospica durhamensis]|uniref:Helix-turn-helix domain-containing protein n=1 Tax=Actinospica durhamensis TaxID=1508375 RepID=A0A941IRP4_9ACTN|nr:helix-turn-helix domain-containing protein [Actinospica durhamensis]MBR7832481.1 helix-turn-helix domain-containing protein [Actinospica durhamensis]
MAQRYAPTVLPDGFGVTVYGPDCGLLAGAAALLTDIQAGRVPPAAARQYEASARLVELRDVLASAARDQQAAKHREIARLAQSQPSTTPVFLAPAQPSGSSETATMTAQQAAQQLGVTGQRVRDLCATGRLAATYGPHKVWQINPESVADYATRRRRTAAHDQNDRDAAGEPRAAA